MNPVEQKTITQYVSCLDHELKIFTHTIQFLNTALARKKGIIHVCTYLHFLSEINKQCKSSESILSGVA